MSYRIEREQNGKPALVIDGWDKGLADDPYSGPALLSQVNIGTVPGEVSVGFQITASTIASGTLGVPIHRTTQFTSGSAVAYYILDAGSQVFKATSISGSWSFLSTSNTTTGGDATNQGLAFWKGYLFKFRNNSIDYLANGAGTWVSGWNPATGGSGATSITGSTSHFAYVGRDDVLYFCNGAGIGSVIQVAGATFDPTNTATYTFNTSALALPSYDFAQSIAEQGNNLLVGGSQNSIYVWDRLNPGFNDIINIADNFIKRMVTANVNAYIFTGNVTGRGRILICNGSQAQVFKKMPDFITGYQEPYYKFYDAIYYRNKLVFGVEITQNLDGTVITAQTAEVYCIDVDTKVMHSLSSIPGGSASARVLIPDQSNSFATGFPYMIGYSNGSTHGIGYSGTSAGIGTGAVKSEVIPVGTFIEKRTFNQVEFKLGYPLQTGESIQLSYITDATPGQSATIATFTSSTSNIADVSGVNFEKSQWIQLRADLTGNTQVSGCRLKELRLR